MSSVLVVVAVGAVVWRLQRDPAQAFDPRTRAGSVRLAATEPVPRTAPPDRYDLTYRVEESATDDGVVTTERHQVRRPFESHVETRAGAPPGGDIRSRRTSALGKLGLISQLETRVLAVPPALASGDIRPEVVIDELVDQKLVEAREQREVIGRRCQVYRFGGPVSGGEVKRYVAGARGYADACIDGAGVLLEEVWVDKGQRVRRKVAVDLDTSPDLDDEVFSFGDATELPVESGGGAVRKAAGDFAMPPGVWVLEHPPAGFELEGHYAITLPRLDPQGSPLSDTLSERPRSFATVYVRGPDFVAVDRGDGMPWKASPIGQQVDLGPLGPGELLYDLRTSEVRTSLRDGYVRVFGTLPPADLAAIARRLQRQP